jgi:aspartate--ammonia ligase
MPHAAALFHASLRRQPLPIHGTLFRANAETLKRQLEMSGQTGFLKFPYHQGIIKNEIPLSIGGGIGRARAMMYCSGKRILAK